MELIKAGYLKNYRTYRTALRGDYGIRGRGWCWNIFKTYEKRMLLGIVPQKSKDTLTPMCLYI